MAKYLLFIIVLVCSCSGERELRVTGKTMGTSYSVTAFAVANSLNENKLKKAIDDLLVEYNLRFSTYIEKSELSIVNRADTIKEIQVSSPLLALLKKSEEIFIKSNGMYDVTVGPLVNRWGFGPVRAIGKPSDLEVLKLKQLTGMEKLVLNKGSILKKEAIYIDLSSIAKGDGVDKVASMLEEKFKINSYFVEIGGEVRVRGTKPNGKKWRVGIERPALAKGSGIQKIVELKDESIATSGSYRNFKNYGDSVFSHVINPKTAYPVKHKTISVSVIAKDCASADAWATAFMSMGQKYGLKLAKKEGLKAYFLVKEGGKIKEYMTNNFGK